MAIPFIEIYPLGAPGAVYTTDVMMGKQGS